MTAFGTPLRNDFGNSLRLSDPVFKLLAERLGATFELAGATLFIAIGVGVPAGLAAAYLSHSPAESILQSFAAIAQAVPLWAILGIIIFAVWLGWLPTAGRGTPDYLR
jgi:peptide/nickel transport system permease protein